jgi:trk system potassium uptake protein TrkA
LPDNRVHTMMRGLGPRVPHQGEVVVIGLGRFGSALATTLVDMGKEVLGIDADAERVGAHRDRLTQVAEADSTNLKALRQLGVGDATSAVVAIGSNVEASILTVAALVDLEVPNIWAQATSETHGKILTRVGANNVVYPEAEMGKRVAQLVTGAYIEYVALDEEFVLVETVVPQELAGRTLADLQLRQSHRVSVVCIKPEGGSFTYTLPSTVLGPRDLVVLSGQRDDLEHFAKQYPR